MAHAQISCYAEDPVIRVIHTGEIEVSVGNVLFRVERDEAIRFRNELTKTLDEYRVPSRMDELRVEEIQ